MSEPIKLGKIITTEQHRDAIHIAIAPVTSDESMQPGQHVALVPGCSDRVQSNGTAVGIVDPYLQRLIEPGEKFWLCLYPQTVTSLRHEWTHPAFPKVAAAAEQSESERWLRDYAIQHLDYTDRSRAYEKLLEMLRAGQIIYEGTDMHSRGDLDDESELKRHAEVVLGIVINFDDPGFIFSCTC